MEFAQSEKTIRWMIVGLIAAIFVLDLLLPTGMAEWLLYFIPFFYSYRSSFKNLPFVVAAVCAVLIVLGFVFSTPGVPPLFSVVKRSLGICILSLTAFPLVGRKRAETALRESEDRYHSLVASSMDAVLLTAPDGRILAVNAAACRMFGRSEEELIRLGRSAVVDVLDPRLQRALEERDRTGRFAGELTFLRSDGSKFPGDLSSSVFRNQERELRTSMLIRDVTERKEAEQELRASRKQLELLMQRLVALQETNRRELARELHDRVGQNLTALNLNLSLIKNLPEPKQGMEARIADSLRLVAETMEHVRDVMAELRPPELEEYGLVAALRVLGGRFSQRSGLRVHVSVGETFPRFSPEVETTLFRVAQETLTNIIKHARANEVTVALESSQHGFRLTIADDGVGFDPSVPKLSGGTAALGLATMRERVRTIGWRFGLDSAPGKGTTVIVELARKE